MTANQGIAAMLMGAASIVVAGVCGMVFVLEQVKTLPVYAGMCVIGFGSMSIVVAVFIWMNWLSSRV